MKTVANSSVLCLLLVSLGATSMTSCSWMPDSVLTQVQGTSLGTGVGAAVGAGVGALVGDEDRGKAIAIGAGVGALIGGLAGYAWSQSVVKKKSEYASTEDYIEANIDQLDDRIDDAETMNNRLARQIANLKEDGEKISASDYQSIKKSVNEGKKLIDKDLSNANKALSSAKGEEKKELQEKIAELKKQRSLLISQSSQLDRYKARA